MKNKATLLISNDFSNREFAFHFLKSQKSFKDAGINIKFIREEENEKKEYDAIVYKKTHDEMKSIYPRAALAGLSVTDRSKSPNIIYLNYENWNKIPKNIGSEYKSLDDYRIALISHETAHVLGHDHVHCACVGCESDVRQQPSRELHGCKPTTKVIFNSKSPKTNDNF